MVCVERSWFVCLVACFGPHNYSSLLLFFFLTMSIIIYLLIYLLIYFFFVYFICLNFFMISDLTICLFAPLDLISLSFSLSLFSLLSLLCCLGLRHHRLGHTHLPSTWLSLPSRPRCVFLLSLSLSLS